MIDAFDPEIRECPRCGNPTQPSTFGRVCCTSADCHWREGMDDEEEDDDDEQE